MKLDDAFAKAIEKQTANKTIPALAAFNTKLRETARFLSTMEVMDGKFEEALQIYGDVPVALCVAWTLQERQEDINYWGAAWSRAVMRLWAHRPQYHGLDGYSIHDNLNPTRIRSYARDFLRSTTADETSHEEEVTVTKKKDETRYIVQNGSSIPVVKMEGKGKAYEYVTKPGCGVVDWYSAQDEYQKPVTYDRRDKTQMLRCSPDCSATLYTKNGDRFAICSDEGVEKKKIPAQADVVAMIVQNADGEVFWTKDPDDVKIFVCYDENGLVDSYQLGYVKPTNDSGFSDFSMGCEDMDVDPDEWDDVLTFQNLYLPDSEDQNNTYRANIPGTWEYQSKREPANTVDSQTQQLTQTACVPKTVPVTVSHPANLPCFFANPVAEVAHSIHAPVSINILNRRATHEEKQGLLSHVDTAKCQLTMEEGKPLDAAAAESTQVNPVTAKAKPLGIVVALPAIEPLAGKWKPP